MKLSELQKILDELKTIHPAGDRLFVGGIAVFTELHTNFVIAEVFCQKYSRLLLIPMKYGFRYGNLYFMQSKHIGAHELIEITKPSLRARMIASLKRFG